MQHWPHIWLRAESQLVDSSAWGLIMANFPSLVINTRVEFRLAAQGWALVTRHSTERQREGPTGHGQSDELNMHNEWLGLLRTINGVTFNQPCIPMNTYLHTYAQTSTLNYLLILHNPNCLFITYWIDYLYQHLKKYKEKHKLYNMP